MQTSMLGALGQPEEALARRRARVQAIAGIDSELGALGEKMEAGEAGVALRGGRTGGQGGRGGGGGRGQPPVPPAAEVSMSKQVEKYDWVDGDDTVPVGWKTRVFDGRMRKKFFLAPDGTSFSCRRSG